MIKTCHKSTSCVSQSSRLTFIVIRLWLISFVNAAHAIQCHVHVDIGYCISQANIKLYLARESILAGTRSTKHFSWNFICARRVGKFRIRRILIDTFN